VKLLKIASVEPIPVAYPEANPAVASLINSLSDSIIGQKRVVDGGTTINLRI
jgi:hypothetical protein